MAKTITDIRHAALMAWHADAHPLMKNPDGSPKTFYHGTGRDIEKFLTKPGETTEGAAFFTSHPTVASGFARTQGEVEEDATPVVYPVHVHMKNPKVLNHTDVMKWHEHSSSWMHSFDAMSSAVQKARDEGHDGLYIKKVPEYDDEAPPSDQVAVFKPNQIKSVYNPAPNRRKHNISEAKQGELFRPSQKEAKAQNFKQWFGDSKAVNKAGRPQKMYHTTRSGDFHTFEVGRKTTNSGTFGSWETQRHAIFVTPHRKNSETYGKVGDDFKSGSAVMPLHVSAQNPLDLRDGAQHTFELGDKFKEHGVNPSWLRHFDWGHFDGEEGKHFVEAAKKLGHDSVIFHEEDPDTGQKFETWALFHPHQVKSVWNHGTYKSDSGNISESFDDKRNFSVENEVTTPKGHKVTLKLTHKFKNDDGDEFAGGRVTAHIGNEQVGELPYGYGAKPVLQVGDMYVHPKHQRKGIGTAMFNFVRRNGFDLHHYPNEGDMTAAGRAFAKATKLDEAFFTEDEARAAFKKAYPDGWKMDKNRSGETPWKDGVHSADVIRHFGEDGSKTFIYGNHIPELNRFEIEYSEVHGEHGKGTYTNVLDKLRRHMTVVSDLPGNNSAKGAYKKLGAYEDRNGRYVLDQKKDIKEETMTKLTLTEAENKKKKAELLESVKDKDLMEATHTLLDSGLFELTESMFDDKLASPYAMDRLYIATHGTDAHRDQLLKDEDAMVRFGVAQRGHLTHLNALASDPHPMVRDQVARRGDEELAKKLSTDPHATVRSSAHNRLHELAADEQKKQAEVAESLKEAPHYERGTEIRLVEDGRFATVKAWFETKKQGVFYVVGFPDGKTDMLQESAVIALNEDEDFRSEHDANAALADSAGSPTSKKYKLKRGERVISGHDSEHEAMHAWKNMGDNKGVKIHCESVVDPETLVERHSDTEFAIGRELAAQHGDADEHTPSKPVKLKRRDGTVHSEHDDERSAMDAYKNEPDNKGMKIVRESITEVEIPMEEDFTIPVDGTGLKLDPVQLDQYDAEKAHANECPFCSGEDHENASDEEHQAAMAYHTQAAKAAPTLAEKHFQSRQYMRHQARLKGLI